jgi:cell division septum initiation protein DivIVA
MKKMLSSIVVAGLLVTSSLGADSKSEQVKQHAVNKVEQQVKSNETLKLIKEAIKAIAYTDKAYKDLEKKDKDKALKYLKEAIGELTIILNSPNAPYLLPVDSRVEAIEYVGDTANIAKQISSAKVALAKKNLPLAREILNSLRSEIDITTTNIPLATYPDAIKLAVKYLNENKVNEAKDVIAMALNTLVTTQTIIPIPLIKAGALIEEASKVAEKDKIQAVRYLEEAKQQLKIAELLGYSSKSDTTYKMLKDAIDEIESKLNRNKETHSLFEELKKKLKEFKEKAVSIINR